MVDLSLGKSDLFLTDQEEEGSWKGALPSGSRSGGCGLDGCKLAGDVSQDLISLEEGELRDTPRTDDVELTTMGAVEREILWDSVSWRQQWASRPGQASRVTLIVDKYGMEFDHRDRLMTVQKVEGSDLGQLAGLILSGEVDLQFDKAIIMVGWAHDLSLSKSRIITQMKRLGNIIGKIRPCLMVGFAGLVPNYWDSPHVVMKAVNYNRNISTAAAELRKLGQKVQFLPLHLHFQVRDSLPDRELYITQDGKLTRKAAFILRGMMLQEFGVPIPPVELP